MTISSQVGLGIGEAARRLGVSVHTLRYHERDRLLNVPRAEGAPIPRNAQRRYSETELRLLRFLLALRATGMPMGLIRRAMALVRLGEETVSERRDLLLSHQRAVTAQLSTLQDSLERLSVQCLKKTTSGLPLPTALAGHLLVPLGHQNIRRFYDNCSKGHRSQDREV
ncbi:MerR family transcriptional regulator [Deinococcus sp.]|uniref:MerR family transcriptional regulator n=1 Tax=Deinococcus sp. TaxID=47478 RepID=UPI003C7DB171